MSNGALTFSLSRNDGQSFTSYPVTGGQGNPAAGGSKDAGSTDTPPWVSTDPTHPGRFALMQYRNNSYEVYVTSDAGGHWTGPAVIHAPGVGYGWMEYGTTGVLGVMWRTHHSSGNAGGTIDVYSAVSLHHGLRFSLPLRVTPRAEPAGRTCGTFDGDFYSGVSTDGEYAYIGWPHGSNNGFPDATLGRVPLRLYKGG